ncbi:acetyl-CoA carboxylase biotin carboxylase subunit family protein [Streptomyces sp. NPDC002221]|uniref:ATP-grasp domain-containing protein n=1 Tax=Streptomyces sp. NPDC002221 TaxID=3364639 RepID=UPI0036942794
MPFSAVSGPTAEHAEVAPLIVVLGAGNRTFRRYGLEHITAGHPVALLDGKAASWARSLATVTVPVDLHDGVAVASAIRELSADHRVGGVLTYCEDYVELAAHLAQKLSLPGNTPAAAAACRDKHLTRSLLAAAGVPSARSYLVPDADTAVEYSLRLDGPVVLKPRALAGSAGVHRADTPQQVRDAFDAARNAALLGLEKSANPGVLIEEYLDGPEISVECVVLGDSTVYIAAITHKFLGSEPGFQEVGHLVDATDPLLADPQIHDVALTALNAVGATTGVMHVEMRLTPCGPRIIEINARLGGDLIPHLVHLATGLNLPLIAADLAVGNDPELTPTRSQSAAIRFLYPAVTGRVTTMYAGLSASWLDTFEWTAEPGDHVNTLPHATLLDRLALAVVTGPDPDACHRRLQLTYERCGIHIQPDTVTTACVV